MEGMEGERDAAAETAAPLRTQGASGGRRGSNNHSTSSFDASRRARPLRRRRRRDHARRHGVTHAGGWFKVGVRLREGGAPTDVCVRAICPRFSRVFGFLTSTLMSREEVQPC